jgi:hypothetical protein
MSLGLLNNRRRGAEALRSSQLIDHRRGAETPRNIRASAPLRLGGEFHFPGVTTPPMSLGLPTVYRRSAEAPRKIQASAALRLGGEFHFPGVSYAR